MNKILNKIVSISRRLFRFSVNIYIKRKRFYIVLIYHRVAILKKDPELLTVSPKKFEEQIRYLKENCHVISLKEMTSNLKRNKIPKSAIIITFDDGYADNLYNAKPILEKYGISATVFVTTGNILSGREFWWDELERIFFEENITCKQLEIRINDVTYSRLIQDEKDSLTAYRYLQKNMKLISSSEREEVLKNLFQWAGLKRTTRESHRVMTAEELKELAKEGMIEIGAHTVTHPSLSSGSPEQQLFEIRDSKSVLENILGLKINSFSYPFGSTEDADKKTMDLVRQSGFECGIANEQGNVSRNDNLFWIKRRLIRNWDLNYFRDNLKSFRNIEDILDYIGRKFLRVFITLYANIYYKMKLASVLKKVYPVPKKTGKTSKILQINTHDNLGGAAKISFYLHQKLNDYGIKSKILSAGVHSDDPDVNVIRMNMSYSQHLLNEYAVKNGLLDFFHSSSFEIKDYPEFIESDLVHFHNLHGNYFSPFAIPEIASLRPCIWTLHDMQAFTAHCAHSFDCDKWNNGCQGCHYLNTYPGIEKDTSQNLLAIKKKIYDLSDLTIVCPSKWLYDKARKSILSDKRIELIYNGVDEEIYRPADKKEARALLGLPQNKIILTFSSHGGKENSWKGGSFLTEAYEILKSDKSLLFLNIGGNETIKETEGWMDISYIRDEQRMSLYYSASDLFIYPSLADNCPLVVLESMACGTPVVSFAAGGIPELIEHNVTGYVAEYKSRNDFITGIKIFIRNENLRKNASIESVEKVKKSFTAKQMLSNYVKIYKEITSESKNLRN